MDLIFTNAGSARELAEIVAAWIDSREDFTREEFIQVMIQCLDYWGEQMR